MSLAIVRIFSISMKVTWGQLFASIHFFHAVVSVVYVAAKYVFGASGSALGSNEK